MKKIFAVALAYVALEFFSAHAAQAQVTSTTQTQTASTAGAVNSGVNTSLTFNSPPEVHYSGSYTVKDAPGIVAPAGYGSFSQANCMVSGSAGVSVIGFGATGQAPIDGKHCDLRLDQQSLGSTAMTIHNFVAANPNIGDETKRKLEEKAAKMLDAASDLSCLASDRQRELMEAKGLCKDASAVATLDHREGQPRNYQVDYAKLAGN